MKNQYYRIWAVCSLVCIITACTSNGTNSGNGNSQDTIVNKQYGQQPRDSSSANLTPADSTKNVKTNKGNADPTGRQKQQ